MSAAANLFPHPSAARLSPMKTRPHACVMFLCVPLINLGRGACGARPAPPPGQPQPLRAGGRFASGRPAGPTLPGLGRTDLVRLGSVWFVRSADLSRRSDGLPIVVGGLFGLFSAARRPDDGLRPTPHARSARSLQIGRPGYLAGFESPAWILPIFPRLSFYTSCTVP